MNCRKMHASLAHQFKVAKKSRKITENNTLFKKSDKMQKLFFKTSMISQLYDACNNSDLLLVFRGKKKVLMHVAFSLCKKYKEYLELYSIFSQQPVWSPTYMYCISLIYFMTGIRLQPFAEQTMVWWVLLMWFPGCSNTEPLWQAYIFSCLCWNADCLTLPDYTVISFLTI